MTRYPHFLSIHLHIDPLFARSIFHFHDLPWFRNSGALNDRYSSSSYELQSSSKHWLGKGHTHVGHEQWYMHAGFAINSCVNLDLNLKKVNGGDGLSESIQNEKTR